MALHKINFTIQPMATHRPFPVSWVHNGVVGSGDMEVLLTKKDLGGAVEVQIVTPVQGYDIVWEKVLRRFISDAKIGDVCIEINDNNATPFVVAMRLKQSLMEACGD